MELDYAFLADAAQAERGKLHVLGGDIDRIWSKNFPFRHPHITLIAKFILEPGELDRVHKLEIFLMDADGKKVIAANAEISASRNLQNESWRRQGVLLPPLNIVNMQFDSAGEYSFELVVDGRNMKSLPLRIISQVEEPAGA